MFLPSRTVASTACPSWSFREVHQNAQTTCGRPHGGPVTAPRNRPEHRSRALQTSYWFAEVFVNLYAASAGSRRRYSHFSGLPVADLPRPATSREGKEKEKSSRA